MMAPPPGQQVHILSPEQQSVLIAGLQGNRRGPGYLTPYRAPNIRPSNNIPSASSLSGSEEDLAINGQPRLGAAPSNIPVPESRNGHDRIKPVSNNGVDGVVKKPKPIPLPKPKNYIASRPQIKPKPKPRRIPDVPTRQTVGKLETSTDESRPRNSRGTEDSGHSKRPSLQRNHPVKDNWVKLDKDERTAAYRRSVSQPSDRGKPLIPKKPVFLIKPGGENIQIQLRREESTASWDSHDSGGSDIFLATKPNSSEFQRTSDGSETGFQKAADVESRLEIKQLREISRLDGDSKMRIDGTTGEEIYTPTSPRASVSSSVEREQILSDSNKVKNSKPMVSLRIMSKQTQKDFVRYGDNANVIDDWSSDTSSQSADKYPNLGGAGKITRDRPAAKRDRSSNQMQDLPQFDPSSAAVLSPPNPGKQPNIVSKLKNLFPKRLSSDEMLSASDAERLLRVSEAQKGTSSKSLEEELTDKPQPKKKKIINQKFKNIKKRLKLVRNENRAAAEGKTLSDDDEAESGDTLDEASDDFDSDDAEYFDDYFGESDTLESNRYLEHGSGNTFYENKPDYRRRESYETAEIIQSSELRVSLPDPVSEKTTLCPSSTSAEEDWGNLENGVYGHCRDEEEETVESPEEEDGRIPDSTRNKRGNSSSDDYEEVASNDQWDEDSEVPEPVDVAYAPIWEDWEGQKVTRSADDVYQPSTSVVDRGDQVINGGAAYGNTPEDQETSSHPRNFDDHIYDLTPSSKTKIDLKTGKAYKYTQIKRGSQKSSITEDLTPVFAIEDREAELVGSVQAMSLGSENGQRVDEEAEDVVDDGASTDSEASCGVAYTEEEARDNAPRKQHSGRYTQDGKAGAVFSFTENIAHHWNQENGTSSALSPGFEKRGPKLPPRMAPPIPASDPTSPYMDMSGKNDEEKDLPLYQVYTAEIKRKETLLLRRATGMEKRRQILEKMQNHQAPSDSGESWGSGGSGSGENSGNSRGTVDGPEPGTEYYADWNLDEPAAGYGLMVAKEVQEDFYEPLDYEDYLESKRKKLFPLWRDQQAVADSGLLEKLTVKEQELQEALYEIITSEHSYLRSISLVVDHFMDSKQLERLLGPSDYRKLFSNIKEVRNVSQRLYDDIEAYHDQSLTLEHIPKIILNHLELFDCYIGYCGNNQHQIALMNKIKKTPEVKAVIDNLEKHPDCQHLDLMSFLMLPFQRITRLPLLMKAVVNRSSSDLAIEAQMIMDKTTHLVHECNNSAKRMEDCKDLAEVLASLDHKAGVKHVELTQPSVIKKKGSIRMLNWVVGRTGKKKISIKKKVFIIATTEKVIIAKEKLRGDQKRFQVQDWCMANRVTIKDISEEQKKDMFPSGLPPEAKCIFRVTFLENNQKQTEDYDLCTQNESDKERWLQALSTSKLGENGEIIYDNFDCPQVICIQPVTRTHDIDELRLELHDRLDVLKKMEDGWLEGRRQRDGKVGWFHQRHVEEIETDHTRARLLKQRHRMGEQSDEETYFGVV
ncbi:uncharacterized protein [Apostichopus japonicus]|uniref:uncharacterized protein isoform X3 n=1 Tax=Stichopus japonicus TaxID=307972 RepID=UPI003AB60906